VAQGELHEFTDLGHLLADTAYIIIADLVKFLLVLSNYGLTLAIDLGVRSNNTVLPRVGLGYLELHCAHATTDKKGIALPYGAVSFYEVVLKEAIKETASNAFHSVFKGKHMDALAVLDIRALMHRNDISQANTEILAYNLVHADLRLLDGVVSEDDAHGIFALLTLKIRRRR